jgi:DNA-binding IclR family transcriptional regulator
VTAAGLALLRCLRDAGQPLTVRQLAAGTHRCGRLTRAALLGARAAGLVEYDPAANTYAITDAGLALVQP